MAFPLSPVSAAAAPAASAAPAPAATPPKKPLPPPPLAARKYSAASPAAGAGAGAAAAAATALSGAPQTEEWDIDAEFAAIAANRRGSQVEEDFGLTRRRTESFCVPRPSVSVVDLKGGDQKPGAAAKNYALETLTIKMNRLQIKDPAAGAQVLTPRASEAVAAKFQEVIDEVKKLIPLVGMVSAAAATGVRPNDDVDDSLSAFDSGHGFTPGEVTDENMWAAKALTFKLCTLIQPLEGQANLLTPEQQRVFEKAKARIQGAIERTAKLLHEKTNTLEASYKALGIAKEQAGKLAKAIVDFRLYQIGLGAYTNVLTPRALQEKKKELLNDIRGMLWVLFQTSTSQVRIQIRDQVCADLHLEGAERNEFVRNLSTRIVLHTISEMTMRAVAQQDPEKAVFGKTFLAHIPISELTKSLTRLRGQVKLEVGGKTITTIADKAADAKGAENKGDADLIFIQQLLQEIQAMMGWKAHSAEELLKRATALAKPDNATIELYQPFHAGKLIEANRDILVLKFLTKELAACNIAIYWQLRNYCVSQGLPPEQSIVSGIVDRAQTIEVTRSQKNPNNFHVRALLEIPIRLKETTGTPLARLSLSFDVEVNVATGVAEISFTRILPPSWEKDATPEIKGRILEALEGPIPVEKYRAPAVKK